MRNPTFILSKYFDSSADFLRYLAKRGFSVGLLQGDSSLERGLRAFRKADRLWFDGIGPLFDELVDRQHSTWLPRAVLHIQGSEIARLKAPDCWWLVSDVVVSSSLDAERIKALGPFQPHKVRIHVIPSAYDLDLVHGRLPWEELEDLFWVLKLPTNGLTLEQWKVNRRVADHCAGKVLVQGSAPDEFMDHLRVGLGCEVAQDQADLNGSSIDTLVLWEGLDRERTIESLRVGLERRNGGGRIIGLGKERPRGDEVGVHALAGLFREAVADCPEMTVQIERPMVIAQNGGTRQASKASPTIEFSGGPPPLSVVVPVHNDGRRICRALNSLCGQTYPDFEILVIDDGSTDETAEVVREFTDKRIRYVYKEHSGRPETRNLGVQEARGAYIAWLDSDDEATPNRIQALLDVVRTRPRVDVVHSSALIANDKGDLIEYRRYEDFTREELPSLLFHGLIGICPLLQSTTMVRRGLYDEIGGYDPYFLRCQDYDFWVRTAAVDTKYFRIDTPTVIKHQTPKEPGHVQTVLHYYYVLARKMSDLFGDERLAGPAVRELGDPPSLEIARTLATLAMKRTAPPEHEIFQTIASYIKQTLTHGSEPACAEAHSILGSLLLFLGDTKGGVRECERALRLDPDLEEGKRNLKSAILRMVQEGMYDTRA
jgi:GT2 family glycosyltransferase